jgi:hypothetical protein
VDVQKMGCWRGEVAQWSHRVEGETLEHWQDWKARAQVQQSFCTPDHTKRCATTFAIALAPGCNRSWKDWNTWSRGGGGGPGTYSQDLLADVSQSGAFLASCWKRRLAAELSSSFERICGCQVRCWRSLSELLVD